MKLSLKLPLPKKSVSLPPNGDHGHWGKLFVTQPAERFQLVRYFSLTSLAGVLIVLTILVYFYRFFAFEALEQHETHDNVAITRIFASTIWPNYSAYVKHSVALSKEELQHHPEVELIRADVVRQMYGLSVVKVKIYDLNGRTVFSTDLNQIGEDKSDNDGFIAAKAGRPVSEITFRNQFAAFEKVINDRNLISTYIPIRRDDKQAPEGVFEVYSDVTEYVGELERATYRIVGLVLASLGLLYVFLFAIVRRADQTIQAQSEDVDRAHQAVLVHQALHDPLTGLPNRVSLTERLNGMLRSIQRSGKKCAILNIGLDGFKEINDSLGHIVGDQTIKEVGRRLSEQFRGADITARMGGDEFVVAISEVDQTLEIELIVQAVERVQQGMSEQPIEANGHSLTVTASIGVAIFPDDGTDVLELLKSADIALSHAKKTGRNSYQFHTADMNSRVSDMLLIERELRHALSERQFLLYFQPQIELASGKVIGAEALIRWQHPLHGLLSPAHFIPVAEERGLIVTIGEWVLHEACRQIREWQQAGMVHIPIAINLSAKHFNQKSMLNDVVQSLSNYGISANCLELELTETSVMQDAVATIATMERLKGVGVLLALDDFGTGYSSLSQLKGLPLDSLKVDQSFVRGLPDDRDDLAICTAVIAMGQALGMNVIAEGVETPEQLAVLRSLGCDQVQGYLFAKPMPADELFKFVMAQVT
jgi:diguanylate cyclase (GGDEF)-like protein